MQDEFGRTSRSPFGQKPKQSVSSSTQKKLDVLSALSTLPTSVGNSNKKQIQGNGKKKQLVFHSPVASSSQLGT